MPRTVNFLEAGVELGDKYVDVDDATMLPSDYYTLDGTILYASNALWTWGVLVGDNTNVNKSSPVQINALPTWKSVSGGFNGTSFAVKTDGTLWAWGTNDFGVLGTSNILDLSSPVQVGALTNWKEVTSSKYDDSEGNAPHAAAIKNNYTLWTWGQGTAGKLGNNSTAHRSSPVQVGALTNWKQVSCGTGFTIAVKTDGTLWAWGVNATYMAD